MAPVTERLAGVPENDVRAISVYIATLSKDRVAGSVSQPAEITSSAAAIYAGACGTCHDAPAGASFGLPLSVSTSLREARPRNVLRVILNGIARRPGDVGPFMPPFNGILTDAQLVELTAYIRNRFSGAPAWGNIADELAAIRKGDPS
jgi:mono/diheme cytochrome c family protein